MSIRVKFARLKRRLFSVPFIRNKKYQSYWFDRVLGDFQAQIVQIGSNDGKNGDPLYELFRKNSKWNGLFVEPIPEYFEALKNNYGTSKRYKFENAAINEGIDLPFYYVDASAVHHIPSLPYWYNQIGSFDRDHICSQLEGVLEPYIIETQVVGMSFLKLLENNDIMKIDILHIDAEGYDWKILSQLNLKKYKPLFILYEYNHLSQDELDESMRYLSEDYHLFDVGIDILAVCNMVEKSIINEMKLYISQSIKAK